MKRKYDKQKVKDKIQYVLKCIVRVLDSVCVFDDLQDQPVFGKCWGSLTADHINNRAYSATYDDPENVIGTCVNHHIFWKPKNPAIWSAVIQKKIGKRKYNHLLKK